LRTVFSDVPSRRAISWLRQPAVTSSSTSRSRGVRSGKDPRGEWTTLRPGEERGDASRDRTAVPRLTARDRLHRSDDLCTLRTLDQISAGSGLQGSEEVFVVFVHGQHEDGELGLGLEQPRSGRYPVEGRHRQVGDHHVRLVLVDRAEQLLAITD